MKQVSFEEIGSVVGTFQCDGDIAMGEVVMVSDSDAVKTCAAAGVFCGVALADGESDDLVAVQVKGFCTVAISGSVAVGYVLLAADGDGGVKTVTTGGTSILVVEVDSTEGTAVICL